MKDIYLKKKKSSNHGKSNRNNNKCNGKEVKYLRKHFLLCLCIIFDMTAKKRWLTKIYPDSQEFAKSTQVNITWSSSESDEEQLAKKRKVGSANSNKWITSNLKQNKINQKKFLEKIETDICQSSSNSYEAILESHDSSSENNCKLDLLCNKTKLKIDTLSYQYCESPIISGLKLEELSPVLVQSAEDFNVTKETSPVLGNKRRVLKKIRSKHKKAHVVRQIDDSSPDLFETQSTQLIDSESPQRKNNITVLGTDDFEPTERIDPFPSQHSSQVITSNTDSSSSITDIPLYHQLGPKKKHYKKGGLASQLQKVLCLQRTRVSIWQHEMYTKKTDNIVTFEEGDIIDFVVRNKWKEYGSTLLECQSSNLLRSEDNLESPTNMDKNDLFIIVIGSDINLNVDFKIKGQYKLFPPYSVKTVNYKLREVRCYFNVPKLVPYKVS